MSVLYKYIHNERKKKIIIIRRRTQRTREWVYIIIYALIQLLCVHIPSIVQARLWGKKRG